MGKKVESGGKDTTETRSLKESGSDGAQTLFLFLSLKFSAGFTARPSLVSLLT